MKVRFELIENIPNGFKCVGCSRLKHHEEYERTTKQIWYFCELSGLVCCKDKDGISLKTTECLLQTRKYLIEEGLQ